MAQMFEHEIDAKTKKLKTKKVVQNNVQQKYFRTQIGVQTDRQEIRAFALPY